MKMLFQITQNIYKWSFHNETWCGQWPNWLNTDENWQWSWQVNYLLQNWEPQLVKKFFTFYGTQTFITMFTILSLHTYQPPPPTIHSFNLYIKLYLRMWQISIWAKRTHGCCMQASFYSCNYRCTFNKTRQHFKLYCCTWTPYLYTSGVTSTHNSLSTWTWPSYNPDPQPHHYTLRYNPNSQTFGMHTVLSTDVTLCTTIQYNKKINESVMSKKN